MFFPRFNTMQWEPYALLEAMHKPVDLIVLNTRQHVVADPTMRLAAQGENVDWFRFWLKGEEDPDPRKSERYRRWRELRQRQDANIKATESQTQNTRALRSSTCDALLGS
jgi:hypothetical protein